MLGSRPLVTAIEGQSTLNDTAKLTLRYRPGAVSNDDLAAGISSVLSDLREPDSDLSRAASNLEVPASALHHATASVEQQGKGFGVDVILLITILAPAENHILKSLWDNVILPHIRSLLGADAVGSQVDDNDQDATD